MASLQQAVAAIRLLDNVSCIMITVIVYDYILTFSDEVEHIWNKRWTWVSTLFILARYPGMFSVVLHAIWWNSAVNLSAEDIDQTCRCNLIFIVGGWCFWIFICSADLVMILRLRALYGLSKFRKLILGILLVFYAIEVFTFFAGYVFLDTQYPGDSSVGAAQLLSSSVCVGERAFPVLDDLQTIAQLALGACMFLLVVLQITAVSIQMYKATGQLPLGRYQILLVREGLAYFIIVLAFALIYQLDDANLIPNDGRQILCLAIEQTLPFTVLPRFVLSLRKVYVGESGGRREDMDTAFGFGPPRSPATLSGTTFAETSHNEVRSNDMEMDVIQLSRMYGAQV